MTTMETTISGQETIPEIDMQEIIAAIGVEIPATATIKLEIETEEIAAIPSTVVGSPYLDQEIWVH